MLGIVDFPISEDRIVITKPKALNSFLRIAPSKAEYETASNQAILGTNHSTQSSSPNQLSSKPLRVALIGSYVPRKCGIATFTHDVFQSLNSFESISKIDVFAMGDEDVYDYPAEVVCEIHKTPESYRKAASIINAGKYDILFIQHEFGLFGGVSGDMIFELIDRVTLPVVTMLHTVLKEPNEDQRRVIKRLNDRSGAMVTMSQRGKSFLETIYRINEDRIEVIPHGIPNTSPRNLLQNKLQFGLNNNLVALTFGLIGPGKGLEYVIDALPEIVNRHPNFIYVLLGATHPNLIKTQGESYRDGLRAQAEKLGVGEHLHFENRFVGVRELTQWIGAADVYLTPYLNEAQITSGTLSYAYGCGTPVVSTPYWHASDLLAEGRGCLVPFRDADAIATQVNELLGDENRRNQMADDAYVHGRSMIWTAVGNRLADVLSRCSRSPTTPKSHLLPGIPFPSGKSNLSHLFRMTDDTGIVQHAICALPNRHEGYCVDDNARALLLTLLLEQMGADTAGISSLQSRYAEFVNHAIDEESGRVRNFMSYARDWLEIVGADDSVGRTSWVLGACIGRTNQEGIRMWANRLYMPVLRHVANTGSLRAWCFGLLGVCEYRRHDANNIEINMIGQDFLSRIEFRLEESRFEDWPWFEDRLTYDNAKLPHAVLFGAKSFGQPRLFSKALSTLEWLCKVQTSPQNLFLPIGSDEFFIRGQVRSMFDQQPVEAWATVSACIYAYSETGDIKWMAEAKKAYDWFHGRNVSGFVVADHSTGGCFDGVHADRVNFNQGAESTLAWLLADVEMRMIGEKIPSTLQVNAAVEPVSNWIPGG
jgi:glycosyltransferase involved in cell wall biosynthesis